MTREEAIRLLKLMYQQSKCEADDIALDMAIKALKKEKEPAPSEAVTSSEEENLSKKNDSTEKAKCQEAINDVMNNMIALYQGLSLEEQRIWELGETYRRILDVQQMIEEDKQ